MTLEEQKQILIDAYINLMRIKKVQKEVNEELEYQIKTTKVKLSIFGIDISELEFQQLNNDYFKSVILTEVSIRVTLFLIYVSKQYFPKFSLLYNCVGTRDTNGVTLGAKQVGKFVPALCRRLTASSFARKDTVQKRGDYEKKKILFHGNEQYACFASYSVFLKQYRR